MMQSPYSDSDLSRAVMTLDSVAKTISQLIDWNNDIVSSEYFYNTQLGMQLLAANCTLITAIGEGINRINRIVPDFLSANFPTVPWRAIVGMRNHIAHGYFELDADVVFESVKNDIPPLLDVIRDAIRLLESSDFR